MNPIVKNIALKLCETAPACILEILLEILIKTWNEYIREFNLPFKRIDIADLKGVTMDREESRNNSRRNKYPSNSGKNMSNGGISTGSDEQTFFDYFRHHIQRPNYQPPLNISFNGISLEADRNQLLNIATDILSEGLPIKVEDTKDSLSCKVDEDISLIDFTDAEDLNPDAGGMNNSVEEYVAASEDLQFKHEASSVDLLEPRTFQDTKPTDAIMINDLKPEVTVPENVSLPEVNHGIGDTSNEIKFLETIYETLPKLDDNSTPCSVITPDLHSKINVLTMQQKLNIKGNKDRDAWNAPDAVKSDVSKLAENDNSTLSNVITPELHSQVSDILTMQQELNIKDNKDKDALKSDVSSKQDVVLFEYTPTSKEKDLLKLYNSSVKAESPKNGVGQTELSKEGEKDLIDFRLPIDENFIDCKTQVLKQQETELELSEKDLPVFTSSTDENSNECEAQVFKQEIPDKEVDIIKDKFVEDRDIENRCRELDFSVGCTNNVTNEVTDTNEQFDYHLYELDFSKYLSMLRQFSTEDIEKEWREPNWSLLEGGENDLLPDIALSFANPRNETRENINGIIDQPKVFNENNTATDDKYSKTELSLLEDFHIAVANENSLLGDLVGQDFKEANIDPFSIVQADTGKQLDNLKYRMNVSEADLLFQFESFSNKRQEPLDIDSSTKQKSRENVTRKNEEVDDGKRKIMQQENNKIEIENELEGVSIDKRKGDLKTKEGQTYNKYCIRPINNRPLTVSNKGTKTFRDPQRLKTGTAQCVKIKYIDKNAPKIYREALKQREDNINNLNFLENERLHGAIGKEVRQSSVKYPSRSMTIKASYKSDGREHPKPQKKVPQVRSKQLSDGNKSPVPSSDINQENANTGKINSKKYNRPLQKPLYSRKIMNKAISKRPCKPSITLVSDIQEQIQEGSPRNNPISNTQNIPDRRATVIGSCSRCIELSPLEIARRNLISRNTLLLEHSLDARQNFRRIRSASKSVERSKRNQSLSRVSRKTPNKKVSFIENENIFSYDPNKSVVENFSKADRAKISKKEENAVGKENFGGVGNCKKRDGTPNENPGDAEGYVNLGFVDVPLFDCLPDFEGDPPMANVANFDEDDQLLSISPTPRVAQDRKLSQRLSVVSRKAEGNVRRWLKYGVMARRGISLKKMRAVMSRK